jgi:branched-chain amino acid transport system permease protein
MLPAGVFAETYAEDIRLVRTGKQRLSLALFLLALVCVPLVVGARLLAVTNIMLVTAVVVVGLQITTGYSGQVNLGQAAFMGVGSYATAVAATTFGLPFWLAIPAGGAAAAAFGFVFGLTAVRIKGFYLALTTIAAQFVFHFSVLNLPKSWLGGSQGMSLEPMTIAGVRIATDARLYYVLLVIAIVMVTGAFGIVRSRHGRAFVAVRDDDVAAGMMGINVVYTKALAFLVGAFFAGVGGGAWAYYVRFVSVEQFTLFHSVWYVGMIIVGGMGSVVGSLVGVVVIRGLQELITTLGPELAAWAPALGGAVVFAGMNVLLGGLIALFLLVEPKGLMHRWTIVKAAYRLWPFPY